MQQCKRVPLVPGKSGEIKPITQGGWSVNLRHGFKLNKNLYKIPVNTHPQGGLINRWRGRGYSFIHSWQSVLSCWSSIGAYLTILHLWHLINCRLSCTNYLFSCIPHWNSQDSCNLVIQLTHRYCAVLPACRLSEEAIKNWQKQHN